jgi:hypothetical protein
VIEKAEARQTKDGDDMVGITLKVIDNEDEKLNGRMVFHNLGFGEKQLPFVKTFMLALGLSADELNEFDFEEDLPELCNGDVFLTATVGVQKGNDAYPDDKNRLTTFRAYEPA